MSMQPLGVSEPCSSHVSIGLLAAQSIAQVTVVQWVPADMLGPQPVVS